MTSHAAVVARGWGKPCVCGCDDLKIDMEAGTVTFYMKGTKTPVVLHEKVLIQYHVLILKLTIFRTG